LDHPSPVPLPQIIDSAGCNYVKPTNRCCPSLLGRLAQLATTPCNLKSPPLMIAYPTASRKLELTAVHTCVFPSAARNRELSFASTAILTHLDRCPSPASNATHSAMNSLSPSLHNIILHAISLIIISRVLIAY